MRHQLTVHLDRVAGRDRDALRQSQILNHLEALPLRFDVKGFMQSMSPIPIKDPWLIENNGIERALTGAADGKSRTEVKHAFRSRRASIGTRAAAMQWSLRAMIRRLLRRPPIRPVPMVIHTPRLLLEPVTIENLALLWHIMESPGLREFQEIPRFSLARFAEQFATRPATLHRGAFGRFEWLIRPQPHHETVGWVSLRIPERGRHRAELGYSLLEEWRRRGFAREAVEYLIDFAFGHALIERIEAYTVPENVASRAVLEGVGLSQGRRLVRGALINGTAVDVLRYEITHTTWLASRRHRITDTVRGEHE